MKGKRGGDTGRGQGEAGRSGEGDGVAGRGKRNVDYFERKKGKGREGVRCRVGWGEGRLCWGRGRGRKDDGGAGGGNELIREKAHRAN